MRRAVTESRVWADSIVAMENFEGVLLMLLRDLSNGGSCRFWMARASARMTPWKLGRNGLASFGLV